MVGVGHHKPPRGGRIATLPPAGWAARAACKHEPYSLFETSPFRLDRPNSGGASDLRTALAICGKCPVRVECEEDAYYFTDIRFAVRGGKTPADLQTEYNRRMRQWSKKAKKSGQQAA